MTKTLLANFDKEIINIFYHHKQNSMQINKNINFHGYLSKIEK